MNAQIQIDIEWGMKQINSLCGLNGINGSSWALNLSVNVMLWCLLSSSFFEVHFLSHFNNEMEVISNSFETFNSCYNNDCKLPMMPNVLNNKTRYPIDDYKLSDYASCNLFDQTLAATNDLAFNMLCFRKISKGVLIDDRLQYWISFMRTSMYALWSAYIKMKLVIIMKYSINRRLITSIYTWTQSFEMQ